MKKFLAAILVFIMVLSCSCNKKSSNSISNPPELPQSFSAQVKIKIDQLEAEGSLEKNEERLKLNITTPSTLQGITIQLQQDEITTEYKGFKVVSNEKEVPTNSIILILQDIIKVLDTLSNQTNKLTVSDDTNSDYTVSYDKSDDMITIVSEKNKTEVLFFSISTINMK